MSLRVLLATEAAEGLGHVAPWRGLLRVLSEHGHVALMACPQASQAQLLLADTGAKIVQAWWPSMHSGSINDPSYCWEDLLWNLGYSSSKAVAACARYWARLFASEKPDVVLADYAPLAMAMAKAAGIPVIEVGGGFCVPALNAGPILWLPHIYQLQQDATLHTEWAARALHRGQTIAEAFDSALPIASRVSEFKNIYRSAERRCVASSPSLDHYSKYRTLSEVEYLSLLELAGLGADPCVCAPAWCRSGSDDLRLLCYLKEATPNIEEYLAELAALSGWRILIAGLNGASVQARMNSNGLRNHLHIPQQAVDFSKALPMADAFLTNGGIHSLAHALKHSTHCLLVPSQAEQASTALMLQGNRLVRTAGQASHLALHLKQIKELKTTPEKSTQDVLGESKRAAADSVFLNAEQGLMRMIKKVAL
jgi:UDP:flavonoid glycosyltransferase YjiC (YdhE family)